jgi:hypothetical protein
VLRFSNSHISASSQTFCGTLRRHCQLARPLHMANLPALGADRATAGAVIDVLGE